jgi:subtilisin family serine protease
LSWWPANQTSQTDTLIKIFIRRNDLTSVIIPCTMKKLLTIFVFFLFTSETFAYTKYWVVFTDKNATPYSVSNPSAFLSPRSIQRRQNQNISVTTADLPVDPNYVAQVLATGAVTLNYTSRWLNAISITTTDAAALTAIGNLSFVQSMGPVRRVGHADHFSEEADLANAISNERTINSSSAQSYNYGPSYNQVHQINVDCLHNSGYNGAGKIIAVLDDGFNNVNIIPAFDSIRLNNQILGTYDFVLGTPNVYGVGGHGTMCLSDMAANLPGQFIGTAPGASYYLLRTEDATTEYLIEEDNWVAGAEYADSVGADIISTSLYYEEFDDPSQNHVYADMDGRTTVCAIAAVYTARVGMLTFACAGNSGTSPWFYIGSPADADSILAVGAVDATGTIANFSSRGPSADGRIKPDISALGVNAIVVNSSGNVTTASGTSFATPLSAGGAACLWQSSPANTAMQLRHAIQMSADQWNAPDSLKGYGIPDYCLSNIILSHQTQNATAINFEVSPNPNNGSMNFSLAVPLENLGLIELCDVTGKTIYTTAISPGQKNISINENFAEGIYFCRLMENGNLIATKKVIVFK